jgi:hypothetical protein
VSNTDRLSSAYGGHSRRMVSVSFASTLIVFDSSHPMHGFGMLGLHESVVPRIGMSTHGMLLLFERI